MAEENTNVQSTGNTANQQEQTFTQADVDRMIQSRLAREREKYPSEEELSEYRTWKENSQTEQQRQAKREKEFTKAQSDLAAAQGEVEQLKREKYVLSKGIGGDEAEFILFKASKLVDEKTTFEQAVDKLTVNRQKVKFDWTGQAGGGSSGTTANSIMNDLIRGARK